MCTAAPRRCLQVWCCNTHFVNPRFPGMYCINSLISLLFVSSSWSSEKRPVHVYIGSVTVHPQFGSIAKDVNVKVLLELAKFLCEYVKCPLTKRTTQNSVRFGCVYIIRTCGASYVETDASDKSHLFQPILLYSHYMVHIWQPTLISVPTSNNKSQNVLYAWQKFQVQKISNNAAKPLNNITDS